jgi:hypothetical protein
MDSRESGPITIPRYAAFVVDPDGNNVEAVCLTESNT